ncbi:hypothetical protein PSGK_31850 [Pseudomonas solani]|uniref:hypothetical protein n=1 Tax=Pseudomonas TaxID=286 RepID=UPI000DA786F1|nr:MULTISPECIES: hypothetical protein [unclassified Pseudomonas]MDW3715326.1 hypothetical protein [Pseudomonas sp. 2023EL-01195]PZE10546.1 hypothetical protein DMX10_25535 [Pseudomonas sp. 57B-090624]
MRTNIRNFHDTTREEPCAHMTDAHRRESERLAKMTEAFLASGGTVEQVGFQMSEKPKTFVINPHVPLTPEQRAEPVPPVDESICVEFAEKRLTGDDRLAALVLAEAALGHPPKRIAFRLGMTEKRVRQLARQYHIKFQRQR